jgi:hypothetical protein
MTTSLRALAVLVPLAASLMLPSLAGAEAVPFSFSKSGKLKSGRPFSVKIAESPYIQRENEPSDDGSRWGIDGGFPRTSVATFSVDLGGTPVYIPRKLYRDLSYVNRVEVSEEEGHLVIDVRGGDAAGSYRARFLFRDFEIERMVRGGEFPTSVWERTVYHNSLSVDVE